MRLSGWLDHFGLVSGDHFREFNHLGDGDSRPSTVLKNLPKLVSVESQLRGLAKRQAPDVAFISRRVSPFSNGTLEARILSAAHLGIYDFDDAIYNQSDKSFGHKFWSPRRTWSRSVLVADLTIAANELLAEDAAVFSSRVVVIPSLINPSEYMEKQSFQTEDERVILWIGSPSTANNLELLVKPLETLNKSIRARVLAVGAQSSAQRALGPHFTTLPWSLDLVEGLSSIADVGVMPLRNSFSNSRKSGYKLLQYSAMGLPSVVSPVGISASIADRVGALKAASTEDWESLLHDLLRTSAEQDRRALGQRQRKSVIENYSYKAWAEYFSSVTSIHRPM